MNLETLQKDKIAAMKIGADLKKQVLTDMIDAVQKAAITPKGRVDITDALIDEALIKYQKMVQEMIDTCPASRVQTMAIYKAQMEIVKEYAPQLLTDPVIIAQNIELILLEEGIEVTEENIFIAAACKEKGIAYLKGEGKVMVRKNSDTIKPATKSSSNQFSVTVNGHNYNVEVADGFDNFKVKSITPAKPSQSTETKEEVKAVSSTGASNEITATMSAGVFKILVNIGDSVKAGQTVVILEAMKMEIPIEAGCDGEVEEILISQGQTVEDGQLLVKLK